MFQKQIDSVKMICPYMKVFLPVIRQGLLLTQVNPQMTKVIMSDIGSLNERELAVTRWSFKKIGDSTYI